MQNHIYVGISQCLLGAHVRWDGGGKKDAYLTEILGHYVSWVPVCPEVEVGMGVPRETVHLIGQDDVQMLGTRSQRDWTKPMKDYAQQKMKELSNKNLSGFILKNDSPSCGLYSAKIKSAPGGSFKKGKGLFARVLEESFPLLPIEEEGRLNDPHIRENFIIRIFAYHRLNELWRSSWKPKDLVIFHTTYKYLLLAHSQKHYRILGRVVADIKSYPKNKLVEDYSKIFMEALTFRATRKKNVNVLQHMHGFFRNQLPLEDREEMLQAIKDYESGYTPLIVPVTLMNHHVRKYDIAYLKDQVYLHPHPKELMLRNSV